MKCILTIDPGKLFFNFVSSNSLKGKYKEA